MATEDILLLGAGGHARACIDVIEAEGRFRVAGLVGLPRESGLACLGHPVLGSDEDLARLAGEYRYAIVGIGQIGAPGARVDGYRRLGELGFARPVVVSPRAHVSRHARIGEGRIAMHGSVINAGASIGANCIVNSQALVEHDAVIGDHCHVATGAIVNGGARVGPGSFIGSGAVLREGISIGAGCVVGMGVALRHDLPDHARFLGGARP